MGLDLSDLDEDEADEDEYEGDLPKFDAWSEDESDTEVDGVKDVNKFLSNHLKDLEDEEYGTNIFIIYLFILILIKIY